MNARFKILATCALVLAAAAGRVFAGELRDPMRPAGASAAPAPARPAPVHTLKLEGVIAGAKRVAIVNGRLVRAGDTVAGARILEVSAHGLRYERAGKIHTLTLAIAPANTNVRVARSDKKP
jgi:MSHA biogenesis protein MshK